jgi:hypothetical protein
VAPDPDRLSGASAESAASSTPIASTFALSVSEDGTSANAKVDPWTFRLVGEQWVADTLFGAHSVAGGPVRHSLAHMRFVTSPPHVTRTQPRPPR